MGGPVPHPLQYTEIAAYARATGQDVDETFALVSDLDNHMVAHLAKEQASAVKGHTRPREGLGGG